MLTLLKTGHVSSCPSAYARQASCTGWCETLLYVFTGILAISAGIVEGGFGLSLSLVLVGDGLHALADGMGDIVSAFVAYRAHRAVQNGHEIRRLGNRIIATLIFLSSLWILWEVWERFASPPPVNAMAMIIAPLCVMIIHITRVFVLHGSPFHNITRTGLLKHAIGDLLVSMLATGVGILAYTSKEYSPTLDLAGSVLISGYLLYVAQELWRGKVCHH